MNIGQFELCSTPNVRRPNQLHEAHPETGRFITICTTASHFYFSETRMNPYQRVHRHILTFRSQFKHFSPIFVEAYKRLLPADLATKPFVCVCVCARARVCVFGCVCVRARVCVHFSLYLANYVHPPIFLSSVSSLG